MKEKKKYRSLGINAVLNGIKSGLLILFPLITYPYALRVLKPEGIGKVNYAGTLVGYFGLLASLGIGTYAVREGAKLRDDRQKLQQFARQIFTINVASTILAYVALLFCVLFVEKFKMYSVLIFVSSISILAEVLGTEWINTLYEDYLFITIRSIVTHLISLVLLFLLIKSEDDYIKYAFLSVLTSVVICLSNMLYCRRYVTIGLTKQIDLSRHIKPIMVLFANSIATSIYVSADVTMLGWMCGDYYVGLYTMAMRVYGVVKKMLVAVYSVAIPRISLYAGNKDYERLKETYTSVLSTITMILIPASAGLIVLSREVVLLIGGREYIDSVATLQLLSLALVGAIFGGAVTYVLNIPLGREKNNVIATILSAIINIILNIFIIKRFKQNGAAFTTVISEFFVFLFCLFKTKDIKNYVDIKRWLKSILHAGVGVVWIIAVSFTFHLIMQNLIAITLSVMAASMVGYAVLLFIMRDEMIVSILNKFSKKRRQEAE